MLIVQKVKDAKKYIAALKKQRKRIGFVPTMGALHAGHLALVKQCATENDIVVVSIFVNPTQFNNPIDLEKYPRTPEHDIDLLSTAPTYLVFIPLVEEIYPPDVDAPKHNFHFGTLDKVLEGEFRPGHFEGMSRVVNRLLHIIEPDSLFMGLKDFQQFTIVRSMLNQLHSKVSLVPCETFRERDGLAMSSRNTRLSTEQRALAPKIYKVLLEVQNRMGTMSPADLQQFALSELNAEPQFRVEYFNIVDGRTLQAVETFAKSNFVVALTAVFVGEVRLIDNIILKRPKQI